MAAIVGNTLIQNIIGRNEAELLFRPWWDDIQDYLMYAYIVLGLIALPTSFINSNPLHCNYCQESICGVSQSYIEPRFNSLWVRNICMDTAVDSYGLYYPYILLGSSFLLIFIEKIFVRAFKSQDKINLFYNLIAKEAFAFEEKSRNTNLTIIKILHGFQKSSNVYFSYLLRTGIEILFATCILLFSLYHSNTFVQEFLCEVHGHFYECSGLPYQFYSLLQNLCLLILCLYLLFNIYNLLWLTQDSRQILYPIMKNTLKSSKISALYFANRDLQLLLNLYTENGLPILKILLLFDDALDHLVTPINMDFKTGPEFTVHSFEESPTLLSLCQHPLFSSRIYIGELYFLTSQDSSPSSTFIFEKTNDKFSMSFPPDLREKEHKIRISLIINGRIIKSLSQSFQGKIKNN